MITLLGTVIDDPLNTLDIAKVGRLNTGAFGLIMRDGLVALIYAKNEGHHEFPGGGVEPGETPLQTFRREIMEEVGYTVTDCKELGIIREVWSADGIETLSHLFIARAIGKPHKVTLTEKEVRRGIILQWLSFDEAAKVIMTENPDYLMGRMKHGRDVIALKTLRELVNG